MSSSLHSVSLRAPEPGSVPSRLCPAVGEQREGGGVARVRYAPASYLLRSCSVPAQLLLGNCSVRARGGDDVPDIETLRAEVESLRERNPNPDEVRALRDERRKLLARERARRQEYCGLCLASGGVRGNDSLGAQWPCPECGRHARHARATVSQELDLRLEDCEPSQLDWHDDGWWRRAVAFRRPKDCRFCRLPEGAPCCMEGPSIAWDSLAFLRVVNGRGWEGDGVIGPLPGRSITWAALACHPRFEYVPAPAVGMRGVWRVVPVADQFGVPPDIERMAGCAALGRAEAVNGVPQDEPHG